MHQAGPVGPGDPFGHEAERLVVGARLEQRVGQGVGAMGIVGSLFEGALGELSTSDPLTGFEQGEGVHGLEPPVVAVVGGERGQEVELLDLAVDSPLKPMVPNTPVAGANTKASRGWSARCSRVSSSERGTCPETSLVMISTCRCSLAVASAASSVAVSAEAPRLLAPRHELMLSGCGGVGQGEARVGLDRRG